MQFFGAMIDQSLVHLKLQECFEVSWVDFVHPIKATLLTVTSQGAIFSLPKKMIALRMDFRIMRLFTNVSEALDWSCCPIDKCPHSI
jgi:hypothetical protein